MKWRERARHISVAIGLMFVVAAGIYLAIRLFMFVQ
jgi:hypothetical protein